MISFSKIGKCESTPLVTFCHSMEENKHPFFRFSFVQNFWNSIQSLFGSYNIFSEIDVILGISSHLKIRFFTITLSYSRKSIFTVVNLRKL